MWIRKISLPALVLLTIFLFVNTVFAQTETPTPTPGPASSSAVCTSVPECADQKFDCSKCVEYLTNKKNEASGKAKTLSSEISTMNNQIKLTEARINATEQLIEEFQADIEIAKGKITELEGNIDRSTRVLVERIVAVYQVGQIEPWQIFLTASNIDDVFSRLKYLRIVQILKPAENIVYITCC